MRRMESNWSVHHEMLHPIYQDVGSLAQILTKCNKYKNNVIHWNKEAKLPFLQFHERTSKDIIAGYTNTHTYYPVLHNAMTKTNCQDWFVCNKNVSYKARSCLIRAHSRCQARGCPGWTGAAWRGWEPGTAVFVRGQRCSAEIETKRDPLAVKFSETVKY